MNESILELESILKTHAMRYPLMQPTDAVKLIYQNEFGGGHMIPDRQACLDYLHREYASIAPDNELPLTESIGNGIVRVMLSAVAPEELDALGDAFIRSANAHAGSMEQFLYKLEALRSLTRQGIFSFDISLLEDYLLPYASAGYPPVSHSEIFRSTYHPAYRIVLLDFLPASLRNRS